LILTIINNNNNDGIYEGVLVIVAVGVWNAMLTVLLYPAKRFRPAVDCNWRDIADLLLIGSCRNCRRFWFTV